MPAGDARVSALEAALAAIADPESQDELAATIAAACAGAPAGSVAELQAAAVASSSSSGPPPSRRKTTPPPQARKPAARKPKAPATPLAAVRAARGQDRKTLLSGIYDIASGCLDTVVTTSQIREVRQLQDILARSSRNALTRLTAGGFLEYLRDEARPTRKTGCYRLTSKGREAVVVAHAL